jgi:hypothetical protein
MKPRRAISSGMSTGTKRSWRGRGSGADEPAWMSAGESFFKYDFEITERDGFFLRQRG